MLTLTAAATLTATGLCAQNSPVAAVAQTSASERLLAPSSYEEYLTLDEPSDSAISDDCTVIADGKVLYIFNREQTVWQTYRHTNPVTKLQFGARNELYFLDGTTNALYLLNVQSVESASALSTGVVCSTFHIRGEYLYYANTSAGQTWIRSAPLSDLSTATELFCDKNYCPSLSYWNGEIYFMYGTNYLHRISPDTKQATGIGALPQGVNSMLIADGVVYCTTEYGDFYGYSLEEFANKKDYADCTPVAEYSGSYSALSLHEKHLYLVEGTSIRQYSLTNSAFTDYEITASSNSANRFAQASEVHLFEDKLFIADDGNDRISIYDRKKQAFLAPVSTTLDTPYLATCGNTLLAASGSQAILYSLGEENYGSVLTSLDSTVTSGKIVGVTCVYGNYYIVTDENRCYAPTLSETGYSWTETNRKTHCADGLTSDADGYLYVRNGDSVYRYTEATFNDSVESGVKLTGDLPTGTKKIAVDYGGNLYALAGNKLTCFAENDNGEYVKTSEKTFSDGLVYGVAPAPLSFTFGVEENEVYVLYQGDYITQTEEFNLPTVKTIPTQAVDLELFSDNAANYEVVTTKAEALLVEFDVTKLSGASVFPYVRYFRQTQPITALKVGKTEEYTLLSYREDTASAYRTYLVANENCERLTTPYKTTYEEEKTGFVTGSAYLYKYPSMGLPTITPLDKDEQITLIGEVIGLDCNYYEVRYGERIGYITKANVLPFNGAPLPTQTTVFGDVGVDKDSIWRLAYLCLGAGAICILVDFLILRKKHDD